MSIATLPNCLSVTLGDMQFASPILNASGAFNAALFSRLFPLDRVLGGIVTKTVTPHPQAGNAQHRTRELPGIGMLNSIGIQNPGLDMFLEAEASVLKEHGLPLILSISAHSTGDFVAMAEKIMAHPSAHHIDALELNLSCPNVEKGGIEFGGSPALVKEAVSEVAQIFGKPLFAKLTPNVSDIVPIGEAAAEGGATALTAINTVLGCAIDIKTRRPALKRISGGYSGPGIKPIAIHHIYRLHRQLPQVPIIGVGGIANAEDALEFLMAGASMVQVGTSCFRQPTVFVEILNQLRQFCETEGIASLSELTGCAHPLA